MRPGCTSTALSIQVVVGRAPDALEGPRGGLGLDMAPFVDADGAGGWGVGIGVATLDPGNYTAIVRGVANTQGVALVEAYGLD